MSFPQTTVSLSRVQADIDRLVHQVPRLNTLPVLSEMTITNQSQFSNDYPFMILLGTLRGSKLWLGLGPQANRPNWSPTMRLLHEGYEGSLETVHGKELDNMGASMLQPFRSVWEQRGYSNSDNMVGRIKSLASWYFLNKAAKCGEEFKLYKRMCGHLEDAMKSLRKPVLNPDRKDYEDENDAGTRRAGKIISEQQEVSEQIHQEGKNEAKRKALLRAQTLDRDDDDRSVASENEREERNHHKKIKSVRRTNNRPQSYHEDDGDEQMVHRLYLQRGIPRSTYEQVNDHKDAREQPTFLDGHLRTKTSKPTLDDSFGEQANSLVRMFQSSSPRSPPSVPQYPESGNFISYELSQPDTLTQSIEEKKSFAVKLETEPIVGHSAESRYTSLFNRDDHDTKSLVHPLNRPANQNSLQRKPTIHNTSPSSPQDFFTPQADMQIGSTRTDRLFFKLGNMFMKERQLSQKYADLQRNYEVIEREMVEAKRAVIAERWKIRSLGLSMYGDGELDKYEL